MTEMKPDEFASMTIAVVIPTWNGGRYIARALNSVFKQTRLPNEIIVVDDGSDDDTADIIKTFGDRVKYIYQNNAGASAARNTGIKAAGSEWIAFLDSDDEFLPDRLEIHLNLLRRNTHLVWATGNFYRCLCSEKRKAIAINQGIITANISGKEYFKDYLQACLLPASGCTNTMLIKKEVIEESGGFFHGQKRHNDTDLWFRIAYRYPQVGFSNEPLAIIHQDIPGSITHIYRKSPEILIDFIDRHIQLSKDLNRFDSFQPLARYMVESWSRSSLFDNRIYYIGNMMKKNGNLMSARFKCVMTLLIIWPWATNKLLRVISWTLRTLKLSKSTARRPG